MPQKIATSTSSGSRPASSAPARTCSIAQATAAGFAPTCGMAMSASAPARRRFLGPVAATAIGTRSPVAQRRRIVAAVVSTSSPASSARTCGTTSANFLVATCFRPSVRTALSPRPRPRITRPGWSCASVAAVLALTV